MRTIPSHIARLATVALAAVLCVPTFAPVPVFGAPVTNAKIRKAQAQADEAEARLEDLQADLESRAEDYAQIEAQLQDTTADLTKTRDRLERETARLEEMSAKLSRRAAAMYRTGPLQTFTVFFGVRDFSDLATRVDIMARIGRSDANTVEEVKRARAAVQEAETSLENRRAEEVVLRRRAAEKKAEVQQALDAQATYLKGLENNVKKLMAQERERRRKAAEEAARRAAAAAAAAANHSGSSRPAGQLGSAHPEAVDIAMKYLGVPYVWGGTTPSGFDCSGLMQYSYAQLGISIPRTSREQFRYGAFIPEDRRDLLEPGDLVFFGRGGDPDQVHHVGMYVGSGNFIEAPYTGANVMISSLDDRISRRGDYVGATRP